MKNLIAGAVAAGAVTLAGGAFAVVTAIGPANAGYGPTPQGSATPAPTVTVTPTPNPVPGHTHNKGKAGVKFTVPISSGIVGLKPSGHLTWKWVSAPAGVHKNKHKVHHKSFTNGELKVNLKGKAFPKPGLYTIQIKIGHTVRIVAIKVK